MAAPTKPKPKSQHDQAGPPANFLPDSKNKKTYHYLKGTKI